MVQQHIIKILYSINDCTIIQRHIRNLISGFDYNIGLVSPLSMTRLAYSVTWQKRRYEVCENNLTVQLKVIPTRCIAHTPSFIQGVELNANFKSFACCYLFITSLPCYAKISVGAMKAHAV
jgi:hypothetical protein